MEQLKCFPVVFKDDNLTVGGHVKSKGEVLKEYFKTRSKPPNLNCRVKSFSRICQTFDSRRRRWVYEMGFGGLLYLTGDLHLPRQLCYWLMTRIDPFNKMLITPDGSYLRLCRNQVHWVLGIPNGRKAVPTYKTINKVQREKTKHIISKYGQSRNSISSTVDSGMYSSIGIPVYPRLMDMLECHWEDHEEDEFKTLFLLLALDMAVVCSCPALSCAMDALDYDWCTLVLTNLLRSVRSFGRRFYSQGHAGGCGGCTLFALIFYLDRLDREAVDWCVFPRLKVWNFKQIILASKEDRSITGGDYGKIGTLDVAYGEIHPRQARDTDGPVKVELDENMDTLPTRARRGASRSKYPHQRVDNKSVAGNAVIDEFHTTLTRTKTAAYGYDAPYGHSFLEALNRGISKEAMFLFRRITSFVMSNCTSSAVFPLRCEVVSFGGGCSQLQKLVTPSLFSFVTNPGSRFLVVVSEVYVPGTPTSVTGTPVFFHICVALKATSPSSEMLLIHADSVAPTINVDKRSIMNSDQVHDNIFQYCLKGLAECKLSRNLVLLDTSRP